MPESVDTLFGPLRTYNKSRRLRKRAEFLVVQGQGRAIHSRHFVVVCRAHPDGLHEIAPKAGRLGITVSKKIGNAVARNRVKRIVREFIRGARQLSDRDWLPSGFDVVVIAKTSASLASTASLWSDLESHPPKLPSSRALK